MELYPELEDYILYYGGKFFTDEEKLMFRQLSAREKNTPSFLKFQESNPEIWKWNRDSRSGFYQEQLQDGWEVYKKRVVERLLKEHGDELNLNLCPNCNKIARTPQARQCRFCGHDWH